MEMTSSHYNPELDVVLTKGEYQLSTADAIYSYGNRYDNFRTAFEKLPIEKFDVKDVLLLGLGLGSIPYMLENKFKRNYQYTAVEIDDEIIYLAAKYVLNDLKSDIQTVNADALTYMEVDQSKYDLICMDIFENDYIPEVFQTKLFLETLKKSMTDKGILLFNRLYLYDHDKQNTDVYFEDVFKQVFPNGYQIDAHWNKILVGKR